MNRDRVSTADAHSIKAHLANVERLLEHNTLVLRSCRFVTFEAVMQQIDKFTTSSGIIYMIDVDSKRQCLSLMKKAIMLKNAKSAIMITNTTRSQVVAISNGLISSIDNLTV